MSLERGKFVVFEGPGGCGKGTQIQIAERLLTSNGLSVVTTREPGGTEGAEKIRQLIFDLREKKLIGPEEQMVLFFAARKLWVEQLVRPSLKSGKNVLADRCYTSTGAYQGYAEGGDLDRILEISDIVMRGIKPDAIILLDVSAETSMSRRNDPNGDPFDKETISYFERVVAGYREMAHSGWGGLNWYRIDGEPSVEEVSISVKKVLEDIFQRQFRK